MSEERIIYRTQHLRGTKEEWNAHINNSENEPIYGDVVVPLAGEFAIEIDESDSKLHRLKIGDGHTPYNDLPYMSVDNFVLPARIALTLTNKWTEKYQDDDAQSAVLYYYQNITTEQYGQVQDKCIDDDSIKMLTSNSRVDLYNTSVAQLIDFKKDNLVFQAENDPVNGIIKVICLENKPSDTINLWCTITELIDLQPNEIIYGNIVGVPTSGGSSSEGGVTSYDKLSDKPTLVGRKHINNGEVFNTSNAKDYPPMVDGKEVVNNTAMGEYTASFGHGSRSGIKGYKILDITIEDSFADIKIDGILSEKWQSGDLVYIDCKIHSMGIYKIDTITTDSSDNNSIITILHPENKAIDSRLVMSASDENGMENWIWNPNYPDDGEVVIRSNTAFSSGDKTHVVGYGAVGFGRDNKVYGDYGFAGGRENTVNYAGTAFGKSNKALGYHATATGYENNAPGKSSFVTGYRGNAEGEQSFVSGSYCKSAGNNSFAGGYCAVAESNDEEGLGGAFAFGVGHSADPLKASGKGSISMGIQSKSNGTCALSIGTKCESNGDNNIAMGNLAKSQQCVNGVAIGYGAQALADGAVSLGCYSKAGGKYSLAGADHCETTKQGGVALGHYTKSSGVGAVALGERTEATAEAQVVVGKWNNINNEACFIVGNGSSTTRKNAFVVYQDGHAEVQTMTDNPNPNTVVIKSKLDTEISTLTDSIDTVNTTLTDSIDTVNTTLTDKINNKFITDTVLPEDLEGKYSVGTIYLQIIEDDIVEAE